MRIFADDMAALLRKPVAPFKRKGPRERALAARLSVLSAVGEFGHLRVAEISAACYPGMRWGLQLARRCINKCAAANELRRVSNSIGSASYVLTNVGANVLHAYGRAGRQGLSIRSVSGGTFMHHSINSRHVIEQRIRGHQAFTEYAIAGGRAPISDAALLQAFKKRSDCIVIKNDAELWLGEIESARKSTHEIMRILLQLDRAGLEVVEGVRLAGVIFAFNDAQDHRQRIEAAARQLWRQRPTGERAQLARRCVLAGMKYELPLTFQGMTEASLEI
jgi:hypothetical protein